VGLWASADPASTEYLDGAGVGGVHTPINLATYTYAANNPLRYVDPDGRYWLDWVQAGLDGLSIGMDATVIGAPVSWVPDLLNAGISAVRGDWVGAGMSMGAMIPVVGNAANVARLARQGVKVADGASTVAKGAKAADNAASAGGGAGRGGTKLKPEPASQGPHTTFKRDPETGKVTSHAEWDALGNPVKRTDVTGSAHGPVKTPHTHEYSPPNVNPATGKSYPGNEIRVRPATPDEIPR
jgi:hypothetical protein